MANWCSWTLFRPQLKVCVKNASWFTSHHAPKKHSFCYVLCPKKNFFCYMLKQKACTLNPKSSFLLMWLQGLELISLFLEHRSLWPELPEPFPEFAETWLVQEKQVRWQVMSRRTDWLILTIWSVKRVWLMDGTAIMRLPTRPSKIGIEPTSDW